MAKWINLGGILAVNAKKFPTTIALKDRLHSYSYPEVNKRVNKLCHSLLGLGLKKGDAVSVLLPNTIEIVELYLATAKTGIIIVPINIQLVDTEIAYRVKNSESKAFFVYEEFTEMIDTIKTDVPTIKKNGYFVVGKKKNGYQEYEEFITHTKDWEPPVNVAPRDIWVLLYTSGTTGKPKGVLRSHESYISFYLINGIDFGFNEHDICLNVMTLSHVNTTFFSFTFLYIGATVYIHPERHFTADDILQIIEKEKITFISLIPTQYNRIVHESSQTQKRDVRSIRKLLCSSAPARRKLKKEILDFFPGVELYEGYGSTEAGIVTVLKPTYQMNKLGSIGFESLGTNRIKIINSEGKEAAVNEVGELYSSGPMLFDGYYKMPKKTQESFIGEWFSAGDMAKYDEDGFYYIVDRKDNMIITGGEHVYPSEVEEIICNHPDVYECAVIGLPDDKWGERVVAIIIPKTKTNEQTIIDYCRGKMAPFKKPKQVILISPVEMPRTGTGKIIHRVLRERYRKL